MPVYFIRAGEDGPVKIGVADDVRSRMAYLQTGHYADLVLVRELDGGRNVEAWLHARFAGLRIRGEWYRWTDEMLSVEPKPTKFFRCLPASHVIDKCGGVRVVAQWVRADVSNVHRWTYPKDRGGTGGTIPTRHMSTLLLAAQESGIPLEPADFFISPDTERAA